MNTQTCSTHQEFTKTAPEFANSCGKPTFWSLGTGGASRKVWGWAYAPRMSGQISKSFEKGQFWSLHAFKFANFLVHKPDFLVIVKRIWDTDIRGVYQFSVVKKLRMLKSPLRVLLFQQGNLHKKVQELREKLDQIQGELDSNPASLIIREEETSTRRSYQEALLDEERFLKQKSKVDWLAVGDMNSAFFHSSLKNKVHYSRINVIQDANGKVYEP